MAKKPEDKSVQTGNTECCDSTCHCHNDAHGVSRRDFIKLAGAGLSAITVAGMPLSAMAGPFTEDDFENLIPSDKKLTPAWIKSLYQRGTPEIFSGNELKYIGMPVGGIGCGQLYLGGDGRLWLWDIFKSQYHREDHGMKLKAMTMSGHYTDPPTPDNAVTRNNGAHVDQGFALRVKYNGKTTTRFLDRRGFDTQQISFRGEYPIGRVSYQDAALPIKATLETFSPFVPLCAEDSAIPATILSWKLTNTSSQTIEVDLAGYLENAVCPYDHNKNLGMRRTRVVTGADYLMILHQAEPSAQGNNKKERKDILIADFESETYPTGWKTSGNAFADGPFALKDQHDGQSIQGHQGDSVVNTYNPKLDGEDPNRLTGTLTSPEFEIKRNYISFLISGGSHKNQTCLNLLVDGKVFTSHTGRTNNQMQREVIDCRELQGHQARIEIIDNHAGHWGIITVDDIRQTDNKTQTIQLEKFHGYGSIALALLDETQSAWSNPNIGQADNFNNQSLFTTTSKQDASTEFGKRPIAALGTRIKLAPNQSRTVRFVLGWYFPEFNQKDHGHMLAIKDFNKVRRQYARHFNSAGDVIRAVVNRWQQLGETTQLWNKTWYDSTLPYWLLDRSFIGLDCLAAQTCHWFDNGRFWGWEGVDCCPGTCTHVWQYAQGLARIFPEIERHLRRDVDFGISFHEDSGVIGHRSEHQSPAIDGQAGTILRTLREHRMTGDHTFLKKVWPKVKKAFAYLESLDTDKDHLLDKDQSHTLDAAWSGRIAWISSLYLAAAQACKEMAEDMNDTSFARHCESIVKQGREQLVKQLFNGEYFIHIPDPVKPDMLNTNNGCHIDQVLGQSFAWQVGLRDRVVPEKEARTALQHLWKYNFSPDAGGYALKHRAIEQTFRWYAMPGEAGLLMTTWPRGGAEKAIPGSSQRSKENPETWTGPGGYFNECMNGFEYQAASHMIYEGLPGSKLIEQGLAVAKSVHERYGADKRNPYNEIECSNHYARSMAGYGVFLAVCGFEYDGPAGHITFAPRLSPDNFKAPFTTAKGWGTFSQKKNGYKQSERIELKYGTLSLNQLKFALIDGIRPSKVQININGQNIGSNFNCVGSDLTIAMNESVHLEVGKVLHVESKVSGKDTLHGSLKSE